MKKLILSTLLATACTVAAAEPASDQEQLIDLYNSRLMQLQERLFGASDWAKQYADKWKELSLEERLVLHHMIMHRLGVAELDALTLINHQLTSLQVKFHKLEGRGQ